MGRVDSVLVSLSDLLASKASRSSIKRSLHGFACSRDADVTSFLRKHALRNEQSGASRTYLVLDRTSLEAGKLELVAFFSLAVTVTDYTGISEDDRLQIMGHVPGLSGNDYFPGYLLAQLARDDRYSHEDFDCLDLVETAEDYIAEAIARVGGRVIYLDCKDALVPYYEQQGYRELFYDEPRALHKMLKCAPPANTQH